MILTPHILIGALVGAQSANPIAALVFGIVSHYLLDQIPHWEYDVEKIEQKASGLKIVKPWLKIALDVLFPVFVIGWLAPNEQILLISWAGAIGGALPDFLQFLRWRIPSSKILLWHKTFHDNNHTKTELGLSDGLVSYIIILVLFFALYPS